MTILDVWRAARGTVLRKEFEDAMSRMQDANASARSAFLNNLSQAADHVLSTYSKASKSERKHFLEQTRQTSIELWNSGDWPSSLGLGIALINAQCHFVPGADADYVKRQVARMISEADKAFK